MTNYIAENWVKIYPLLSVLMLGLAAEAGRQGIFLKIIYGIGLVFFGFSCFFYSGYFWGGIQFFSNLLFGFFYFF